MSLAILRISSNKFNLVLQVCLSAVDFICAVFYSVSHFYYKFLISANITFLMKVSTILKLKYSGVLLYIRPS